MDIKETKCVLVIDETLPLGLIANTAAILGITLGKLFPQTVGQDVHDRDGHLHRGIVVFPVPVLRGNAASLRELRKKLGQPDFVGLEAVDFSDVAQSCKEYAEFTGKMAQSGEDTLNYLGIALCGGKKLVNKLTGSLPLLR